MVAEGVKTATTVRDAGQTARRADARVRGDLQGRQRAPERGEGVQRTTAAPGPRERAGLTSRRWSSRRSAVEAVSSGRRHVGKTSPPSDRTISSVDRRRASTAGRVRSSAATSTAGASSSQAGSTASSGPVSSASSIAGAGPSRAIQRSSRSPGRRPTRATSGSGWREARASSSSSTVAASSPGSRRPMRARTSATVWAPRNARAESTSSSPPDACQFSPAQWR